MPAIQRTPSGALLLPRPERRRFALHSPAESGSQRPPLATRCLGAPPPSPGPSRLEQLGALTASVAHDFNNILFVIMVCAGEIADEAGDEAQSERAGEIRAAAERGAELSRRLLAQDGSPAAPSEALPLDAAIVDAVPLLRRTLGRHTEITLSSEGHLPCVRLTGGELERMLVNLAANSRDAMPDGGAVAIRTALVTVPMGDPFLAPGWCVRISFSDSGAGMSPDVASRAVQPYFSTKRAGTGSGLGLATVHALVRSRDGDLRISTTPGSGSTISLYLPAVRATGEPLALPAPAAHPAA